MFKKTIVTAKEILILSNTKMSLYKRWIGMKDCDWDLEISLGL